VRWRALLSGAALYHGFARDEGFAGGPGSLSLALGHTWLLSMKVPHYNIGLLRRLSRRKLGRVTAAGADALVAFVSDSGKTGRSIRRWIDGGGESRWYPVAGGHLVKWPYKGQPPDGNFRVEVGGWDHEHCSTCNGNIAVGEYCWITRRGSFFIVCRKCKRRMSRVSVA